MKASVDERTRSRSSAAPACAEPFDLHSFRAREWRPAQLAAGIAPFRRPYDLRHTYATFALRAGVSIFELSRLMGASLAMIDHHHGHLARDGREHAVALLDAFASETAAWTLGDAAMSHESGSATGRDDRIDHSFALAWTSRGRRRSNASSYQLTEGADTQESICQPCSSS
jgi:hypothetical protein